MEAFDINDLDGCLGGRNGQSSILRAHDESRFSRSYNQYAPMFAQKSDLSKKGRVVFVHVVLRLTRKAIGQCGPVAVAKPLARSLSEAHNELFFHYQRRFRDDVLFQLKCAAS